MQTPFNKYALKGNEMLKQLAEELGIPDDRDRALNVLKAVLHGIRNRITPEQSAQFIAQLPMMIKGIYVDGWQIGKHQKRVATFDKFVEEVYQLGGGYKGYSFDDVMDAERGIQVVFSVLKRYISEGEFNDILTTMPAELRFQLTDFLMREGGLIM
jgi:uncharacterized protein (DUF2267 family)